MQTILIVIHLMIVVALVGVVLLQRSEGGGLGIGGGGGGLMTARGAADTLTRTTQILGLLFFITSISLGLLARYQSSPTDLLDRVPAITAPADEEGSDNFGGVLDALGGPSNSAPSEDIPTDSGANTNDDDTAVPQSTNDGSIPNN